MEILREVFRWSHVVLGFTGLVAFWFPVFSRKGGTLHRRAGKVFVVCGYGVTASAAGSCVLLTAMIVGRGLIDLNRENLASIAFLAYLALVTFVVLRHSMRVLEKPSPGGAGTSRRDPAAIATPLDRGLATLAMAASVALVAFALLWRTDWTPILLALSPVGLASGWGIRRYLEGAKTSPRAWLYEHLQATLGAGIAFHTAFAVFGLRRLFDVPATGVAGMLPWILPAAIGIPGTFLWERHYRRKLGELPPSGASARRKAQALG